MSRHKLARDIKVVIDGLLEGSEEQLKIVAKYLYLAMEEMEQELKKDEENKDEHI